MAVVVFGSINMDLVVRTPRLPAPAESLPGHEFYTAGGGKGEVDEVVAHLGGLQEGREDDEEDDVGRGHGGRPLERRLVARAVPATAGSIAHSDPVTMTQQINDRLEAQVRQHMEQWFWIHRRWKDGTGLLADYRAKQLEEIAAK